MMNINALWHPALMYHRWKNWDGRETFTEPPRRDGREEENDDGVTTRRSTRESAGLT
jgi:hypothetical protein